MRTWNVTGLYKASRDRMPARRSRKLRGSAPASKLVAPSTTVTCPKCGFGTDSPVHLIKCEGW